MLIEVAFLFRNAFGLQSVAVIYSFYSNTLGCMHTEVTPTELTTNKVEPDGSIGGPILN